MKNMFEFICTRLKEAWRPDEPSVRAQVCHCRCGRPVFFRNSKCLGCQAPLGFEPELRQVGALLPGPKPDTWTFYGQPEPAPLWRRCQNFDSPSGCNWLSGGLVTMRVIRG